ncbi:hypothetical protein A9Q81_19440 [Gammaproteobacteria bacterium 42_54_T18]|nr:hypothetical protein A9Q81_19440 [Gammaproteobacteria bacterium 42_54_T18]
MSILAPVVGVDRHLFYLGIVWFMGKLKFLLILSAVLIFGTVGGVLMWTNDGVTVAIDLLFYGPYSLPLGRLILYCFFLGLVFGALLCVAYVFVQSIELRRARKDAESYKQQLDHLRSLSLKDAP